jgi:SAM-dependent methyltransferase
MSEAVCAVCAAGTKKGIAPWHYACAACGYEGSSLEPMINDQQVHQSVDETVREAGLRAIRAENFRQIIGLIKASAAASTLLDVGSAHGWFLEEAQKQFDSVLGIEPDKTVRDATAARGLPVREGFFPDALCPGERFDVIVFNDVIEHIPQVSSALSACAERLTDGGLLVLNLPNSSGFFYRLSRVFARIGWQGPFARLWQKDLPSPHVHYFNKGNLSSLVERHGFTLVNHAELPSIRLKGLAARIRCAEPGAIAFVTQYLGALLVLPLTRMFQSDAIVCIYRKGGR